MNTSVRTITKLAFAALLIGVAGCEVEKSANPLSPSIAGPLPGVSIEAPRPVEPSNGSEILTTSPVRLVFENAKSNSPRPFWHVIEIAADVSFGTKLYTSERLEPDSSGRSSHVVPGRLADGVTYYWRVRAEDGANTSPASAAAYFQVVLPVVIDPPVPVSPIDGATTVGSSPDLVVQNGSVSGPAGQVTYRFEVASDEAFTAIVAAGDVPRSDASTTMINLGALPAGRLYFWRAWGTNGKVSSAFTSTRRFTIPEPVIIDPPVPVSPAGGATTASDTPDFVVSNGSVSGPAGQVIYRFQISTDSAFATTAASGSTYRSDGATTTHNVGKLALGQFFYWRAWATNGQITSGVSTVQTFRTPEPVVIEPPVPLSPIGGATVASRSPDFVVTNGRVSGPAGSVTYRFQVATDAAFASIAASGTAPRSGSQTTTINLGTLAQGTLFYWRAWGTNGQVNTPFSAVQTFRTPSPTTPTPPGGGSRTPDPPPGQRLPLPNMYFVVQEVARQYPTALANSCQDGGGTWEFMDRVVDRLRQYDTRWGYNLKRGGPALSGDVVDYHWGRGQDEGSTEVYIIDIIGGHCGSNPGPSWDDKTQITLDSGTIGRWTGRGRF